MDETRFDEIMEEIIEQKLMNLRMDISDEAAKKLAEMIPYETFLNFLKSIFLEGELFEKSKSISDGQTQQ